MRYNLMKFLSGTTEERLEMFNTSNHKLEKLKRAYNNEKIKADFMASFLSREEKLSLEKQLDMENWR